MKRNRNRGISRYVVQWRVILVLAISGFIVTMQSVHDVAGREKKENLARKTIIQSPELPSIDKVVPAITGTATFGLG